MAPIFKYTTISSRLAAGLLAVSLLLMPYCASAQETAPPFAGPSVPFATHHVVLQLSDASPEKQDLILSVSYNLLKYYGPDKIAIDVVAFADGVRLLYADNPRREKVDSLAAQGVRFDVCENTIDTIKRKTGHAPTLNPHAHLVRAGVARILELVEHHYILVRP